MRLARAPSGSAPQGSFERVKMCTSGRSAAGSSRVLVRLAGRWICPTLAEPAGRAVRRPGTIRDQVSTIKPRPELLLCLEELVRRRHTVPIGMTFDFPNGFLVVQLHTMPIFILCSSLLKDIDLVDVNVVLPKLILNPFHA
jgi:hypothetical protein